MKDPVSIPRRLEKESHRWFPQPLSYLVREASHWRSWAELEWSTIQSFRPLTRGLALELARARYASTPLLQVIQAHRSQVPRSQHTGRFDIRARRGSCAVLRSHTRRGARAFMPGRTAAVELLPARRWPSRVRRSDTLREILQGCGHVPGNRTEVGGVLASREKRAFRSGYSGF